MADDLDKILDRALAAYSDVEPLAGLPERVLQRVASSPRRSKWPWLVVPTALAAALLFFIVIQPAPKAPVQLNNEPLRAEVHLRAPVLTIALANPPRPARRHAPLPKQQMFPMPSSLTAEERALLAFVRRDEKGAAQAFASLRANAEKPIEIPPIQITAIGEEN